MPSRRKPHPWCRTLVALAAIAAGLAWPSAAEAGTANPLVGATFYAPSTSSPAVAARTHPADAARLAVIAHHENAMWLTPLIPHIGTYVQQEAAAAGRKVPVFVVYAIPDRDCGGYSAGGFSTKSAYESFVGQIGAGIGRHRAVFIIEPDALAEMSACLSPAEQVAREDMIRTAVDLLRNDRAAVVYIDAGHSSWQPVPVMARDLREAGIADARGFSLNISNFYRTSQEDSYGDALSAALGGKTFVVDTSRDGLGPDKTDQWCNPPGRALGHPATTSTGDPHADAYLWIKVPGESDGTCNGGPPSGTFWMGYALGLAQRASF